MKSPAVYILRCIDGRFYTGVTAQAEVRLGANHAGAGGEFTRKYGPCECVWVGHFGTMAEAITAEKQIKGWRREKKLALIEGRLEDLPALSRSYSKRERGSVSCFDRLSMTGWRRVGGRASPRYAFGRKTNRAKASRARYRHAEPVEANVMLSLSKHDGLPPRPLVGFADGGGVGEHGGSPRQGGGDRCHASTGSA
ncbi:MAG: GIY-YIG nuclease family protein [Fimbriimonadia bacterium]|jgi:predicted GIY-YIG superfamily endonuclease